MNKRAFKTDESFLEKISIGAIGTKKAFEDLKNQGHVPIELERGSMSFKIWKEIKIKRVRVPDILCIKCGKRVESRAKTKLEITMSHSYSTQERGWDFGLNDDDFIALIKCTKIGEQPIDWKASDLVQYVPVGLMRDAFQKGNVISIEPKGVTEGFEARITWPSATANRDGVVSNIFEDKLQYKRAGDNRTITIRLARNNSKLTPLVSVGEKIKENQIIASIVPVFDGFDCDDIKSEKYYIKMLNSSSLSDRYAAAKALANFKSDKSKKELYNKIKDTKEHIYIRLEATSSLLKRGERDSISFFEEVLNDPYLENRLECVIILGEIDQDNACELLIKTLLNQEQHPEIRAGAAWSLGELKNRKSLDALIKVFNEVEMGIRVEAARALVKLNEKFVSDTIKFIPESNENARAGIAWALSKSGNFKVSDLQKVMVDNETRKWIAWIIGTQDEKRYISQIEELKTKDKEVYFAVTVLWKILSSWVEGLDIY